MNFFAGRFSQPTKKNPVSIIFLEQSVMEDGLKKQKSSTAYVLLCQILHVSIIGYLSENIGASWDDIISVCNFCKKKTFHPFLVYIILMLQDSI